eukprot:CAMPEP_0201738218 /NCGR_PEP_ID=MMETSP0593-20130828/44425_1 /ASSEMBLY_ACC=CAM_ASM_000672 /TAXON_ID=267983 /ORGANISM="Skeletonema japonicum, Strain CCMP2506" /LENGTH=713 /DNA_ID=CAMNT_0048232371 /DNA_START=186 /DNA_END=2327 /DNA_ORIENTATION=-
MKLMHLAFIAASTVLVSRFPTAIPPTKFGGGGGDKKVVLAIDGGGLRGILSAIILKRVEESIQYQTQDPHRRIGQSFDIIAGTSTGGILATYFSAPKLEGTAAGAVDFYKKNAQKIFGTPPHPFMRKLGKGKWWGIKSPGLLGIAQRAARGLPRHSGSGLDKALSEILLNLSFSELANSPDSDVGRNPSLFLISYDVKYRRPVAFVADRSTHETFFLPQEPLSVPFSPPFESTSGVARLFPGDKSRCHSVVKRWINRFNRQGKFYDKQNCTEGFVKRRINPFTHWGKFYEKQNCTEGFKFGPVNFLGDVQILRDEVAEKWQVLQGKIFDKIKLNGEKPDAITKVNYVNFAITNLKDVKVWRAARASSSAPTYLPPMKIDNFYRRGWHNDKYSDKTERMEPGFFCDGGIVANNPGLQALLYLMASDRSMRMVTDTKCKPKDDINARCEHEISEAVASDRRLQKLPKDWEEYNKIALPNLLDNYALLSIGSGSSFDGANVDSMAGSELWWFKQGARAGNLISLLMDNLQMIAHTNLRILFSLAGRQNAYLRIQYRTKNIGIVPGHFDESLRKMDDPSDSTLKDYEDLGDYIADIYAGTIDQFVFLHILTKEERDDFIDKHSSTAREVFNGNPIADDELDSWKSKISKQSLTSDTDTTVDRRWLLFIIVHVILYVLSFSTDEHPKDKDENVGSSSIKRRVQRDWEEDVCGEALVSH